MLSNPLAILPPGGRWECCVPREGRAPGEPEDRGKRWEPGEVEEPEYPDGLGIGNKGTWGGGGA